MTTREQALTFLRGLKLGNYGATMTIYQDVVDHVLGALDEAEADRRRALKRADAFTLDTQTCDEAVQSLCEMIVAARAERDELRSALGATPIATTADVARTLSKMRACVKTGAQRIADERERQTSKLGWTPEHDDHHDNGDLAIAAACYAANAAAETIYKRNDFAAGLSFVDPWPWSEASDARPHNGNVVKEATKEEAIRLLEKAGALCAAEIDRLLRKSPAARADRRKKR